MYLLVLRLNSANKRRSCLGFRCSTRTEMDQDSVLYAAVASVDGVEIARTSSALYVAHKLWFPPEALSSKHLQLGARSWK